eukprot:CAMPEP_0201730098 /NCGR_PEP_ID=MMETSP0593-20130828/21040_1 /ASSEMBLY_ACC=CAM_ASM_000672 /TAXON_ID=267983 /ORGANISM="Skeletonema japonicum, Strain CCMP2506" /LENGTH=105 /DNA_ID=CAMNT_0048222561 /DNA_START=155 /DNA_END=469 /DNA_ORIENTATION=+
MSIRWLGLLVLLCLLFVVNSHLCSPTWGQEVIPKGQQPLCFYPVTCGRLSNILNDYVILPTILGTGCYGVVRECVHIRTNTSFAVKSIEKAKVTRLDHLRREIDL